MSAGKRLGRYVGCRMMNTMVAAIIKMKDEKNKRMRILSFELLRRKCSMPMMPNAQIKQSVSRFSREMLWKSKRGAKSVTLEK